MLKEIPADELARAKDDIALHFPKTFEATGRISSRLQALESLVVYGLPDDYYETYAGKVRALKTSDVEDAAKTVVHPDNLIWVIVGDRAKIEAGVKELGLGETRFLSPDGKPL